MVVFLVTKLMAKTIKRVKVSFLQKILPGHGSCHAYICMHLLHLQTLMNVTVTVMTVVMGLVLTYQALTFVAVLLATSSTWMRNNALVCAYSCKLNILHNKQLVLFCTDT